jgi:hypothetical protein
MRAGCWAVRKDLVVRLLTWWCLVVVLGGGLGSLQQVAHSSRSRRRQRQHSGASAALTKERRRCSASRHGRHMVHKQEAAAFVAHGAMHGNFLGAGSQCCHVYACSRQVSPGQSPAEGATSGWLSTCRRCCGLVSSWLPPKWLPPGPVMLMLQAKATHSCRQKCTACTDTH